MKLRTDMYPHLRGRRGQSMVELAMALPVVLVLGLGLADIGRAFYYREAVGNAARQALRIAVLEKQQATGDAACHGGGHRGVLSTTLPPVSSDPLSTIGNEVSLESTSNGLPTGSALSGATMTMTWNCSGNIALTHASATSTDPAADSSDSIEVQITYPMPLITPFMGGIIASPVQIKADIQGRVQY